MKLGTAPLLSNIQNWRISTTEFECISENVSIPHGTHVYGSVKCVNHIELVKMASTKSETVLYLPPDPSDSKPAFIHEGPGSNVQRNTSSILVTWDAFEYATDNLQYECRITNENKTPITKWKNVGHRTATLIDHLEMKDGQYYFAEIRASAVRNIVSNTTKSGILIESKSPEMTGYFFILNYNQASQMVLETTLIRHTNQLPDLTVLSNHLIRSLNKKLHGY